MKRIFFGLILMVTLSLFVIRSDFLKIKSINVNLDKVFCVDSGQIKNASALLGQNILFLNSGKAKENIKNKFICVRDIITSRSFPNKVNLSVRGRIPVAILKISEATVSGTLEDVATPSAETPNAFLVDSEGAIFSEDLGQSNIPTIFAPEKPENIAKSNLKILEEIKKLGLDPKQAVIFRNYLVIFSMPKIIFRTDSKVDIQLASLQLILQKAKIDDVRLEFVDLRFDKPTARFAPKKIVWQKTKLFAE